MARKIIPVMPNAYGTVVARKPIVDVFDTNAAGELLPVSFIHNPSDTVEVKLKHASYGQLYVEIDE